MIAGLISLIAVLIEAAYFGIYSWNVYGTAYSLTSPFVNNLADLTSPINLIILTIIFVSTFVIVSGKISKKGRSNKTQRRL
jgi:Na+/serine symporter